MKYFSSLIICLGLLAFGCADKAAREGEVSHDTEHAHDVAHEHDTEHDTGSETTSAMAHNAATEGTTVEEGVENQSAATYRQRVRTPTGLQEVEVTPIWANYHGKKARFIHMVRTDVPAEM